MPGPARDAHDDAALRAAFAAVARRMRVQRALDAGAWTVCAGLGVVAVGLGLAKLGWIHGVRAWVVTGIGCGLTGFAYGATRRVSALLVAQTLDRSLGTPDLLGSAWAFLHEAAERRSAFMQACIGSALRAAQRVEPARVLPLHRPRVLPHAVLLALATLAIAVIELPPAPRVIAKPVQKPRLLHQDDIQAFQQETAELHIDANDPQLNDAARELNTLLEALRDQKLDRAEALRELRGLSERLQDAQLGTDDEALREALRELGRALAASPQTEALSNALAAADAAKARAELERLAQQMQAQPSLSADARKKLERALDRAAHAKSDDAKAQLDKARAELERLLKKKNEGKNDEQEQRLLRKKQRELDQLERNAEQRARGERKLDDLRRELGSSGQSLSADQNSEAAQHMQQAAQQMQRAEQSQMSAEQRKQLRDRVEQLRELINKQRQEQQQAQQAQGSQQNGADKQQGQRLNMERFSRNARGGGQPQQPGEDKGQKPDGMLLTPGQGGQPGEPILMPGEDTQNSESIIQMTQEARAGTEAGQGGKPESDRATKLDGTRVDTRVSGEQRAGLTRSQVIRDASQHGFVTRDYERVHGEYERHAEAVIDRDKIPGGYRFYVRRYFQLIRPREETR